MCSKFTLFNDVRALKSRDIPLCAKMFVDWIIVLSPIALPLVYSVRVRTMGRRVKKLSVSSSLAYSQLSTIARTNFGRLACAGHLRRVCAIRTSCLMYSANIPSSLSRYLPSKKEHRK